MVQKEDKEGNCNKEPGREPVESGDFDLGVVLSGDFSVESSHNE